MENRKVRFIRRNGRVIPIRDKGITAKIGAAVQKPAAFATLLTGSLLASQVGAKFLTRKMPGVQIVEIPHLWNYFTAAAATHALARRAQEKDGLKKVGKGALIGAGIGTLIGAHVGLKYGPRIATKSIVTGIKSSKNLTQIDNVIQIKRLNLLQRAFDKYTLKSAGIDAFAGGLTAAVFAKPGEKK